MAVLELGQLPPKGLAIFFRFVEIQGIESEPGLAGPISRLPYAGLDHVNGRGSQFSALGRVNSHQNIREFRHGLHLAQLNLNLAPGAKQYWRWTLANPGPATVIGPDTKGRRATLTRAVQCSDMI